MADDLGNADLGYRGGEIRTPNIDKLATDGVRLEIVLRHAGLHALAGGAHDRPLPDASWTADTGHLPEPQLWSADRRADAAPGPQRGGYQTYMVGKWHLGHADQKYWPQNRGFDHFYGNVVGEVDYFTKRARRPDRLAAQRQVPQGGRVLHDPDRKRSGQADRPAGPARSRSSFISPRWPPTRPIKRRKEYIDRYDSVADEMRRTYVGMITALDDQVGRVVAELEKKGLRDNTIIFFASDNGGATNALFATGPDRRRARRRRGRRRAWARSRQPPTAISAGQGLLYEGGVRVPAFVNWPGKLKPGVVNEPLAHGRRDADAAGAGRRKGQPPTIRSTARTCGRRWPRGSPLPTKRS